MKKLLLKLGVENDDDKLLLALGFVIFIPILLDFVAGVTFGHGQMITTSIYGISLICFLYVGRHRIRMKYFRALFFYYFVCLFNILLFPSSREYFDIAQYLILLYYLPLGFLLFRTIQRWDKFVSIIFIYALPSIIIGVYVVVFSGITLLDRLETYVTYMEFSYALMPFVCISFAFYREKKSLFALALFFVGIVEMLAFGCRGALLYTILFTVLVTIFQSPGKKTRLIIFSLIILIAVINFKSIVLWLSSFSLFDGSYVLNKILDDNVFAHDSRTDILNNCARRLDNMGLEISGLFGDRPYCGDVYPHNIAYEVLMQWGWVFGPIILYLMLRLFIKGMLMSDTSRFMTIFFACTDMAKFFVSDSYINNGLFWIMIACMQSVINNSQFSSHYDNENITYFKHLPRTY